MNQFETSAMRLESARRTEVEHACTYIAPILKIMFDAAGDEYERPRLGMNPFFAGEQAHGAFEYVEDVVFGM
jgi:hypothetical protein